MENRFEPCDPQRLAGLMESDTISPAVPLREGAGTTIDRYKLLELIGEGGFGAVFMAEQAVPVRRRVALKIIKLGMDTRRVVARFEAERQALAMMDHPNIARVLDAGATESGRPYFVMELVRGSSITEYCDKHSLSTRQRLELFTQVCQAVGHAHQKGIIHRDIKPSNVLVTVTDGKPVPKVIDFGIAKATNAHLTEKTLYTEFRQLIGTPQYMSPEQADSDGTDIDTRSDIYSLGVLLYELLTGTTPFEPEELRSAAYAEIQRIIREVEPPTPSGRLSTLGDALTNIAAKRKIEPRKLGQLVRGELDWIVMKAMEKDRGRRYDTAGGLAADIERHLKDEPVLARPAGTWYRLRKFSRKNRVALRVIAAIVLTLVAATIVSSWQAVRAIRARTLAQQALAGEAAQRKQAEAVAGLLESIFQRLDPFAGQRGGPDLKTQLVTQLDEAAAKLDKDYAGEPLVRARLRTALGTTQLGLGEIAKAEALLQSALSERRTHAGPDDPATLTTMHDLAYAYLFAGRYAEAIEVFEQVRDQRTQKLGPDHQDTLETLNGLANAYQNAGRTVEAIKLLQQVRDQKIRKLGPDHPDTLDTLERLGAAYQSAGRTTEAIKLFERVRDQRVKTLGPDHLNNVISLQYLAEAYVSAGRTTEGVQLYEQVRDQLLKALGPDHPVTLVVLHNLAMTYKSAGRTGEAIGLLEQVRDREIKKFGPENPDTLNTLNNLAVAYLSAGRTAEAIELLEQVRDQRLKAPDPNPQDTLNTLHNLAGAYMSAGQTDHAINALKQVRDHWVKELGPDHPDTDLTIALPAVISCYRELGQGDKVAQREAKLRAVLEADVAAKSREIAAIDESDSKLPHVLWERAQLYLRLSKFKEADDDLARLLLVEKADHYHCFYRGCLLAYLGDSMAYQASCKAMFEQFGDSSNGAIIERTTKTCLLLSDGAGGNPKQMLALIERALAVPHDAEGATWCELIKALALYRMGDFSGCVEWADKAKTPDSIEWPARRPTADLLAAMAHFKLGHADQATAALGRAERWAEESLPKAGEGDLGWGEVVNWLVFQTLHREAAALINGKRPSTQPIAATQP